VVKKDGAYDPRKNDLWELARIGFSSEIKLLNCINKAIRRGLRRQGEILIRRSLGCKLIQRRMYLKPWHWQKNVEVVDEMEHSRNGNYTFSSHWQNRRNGHHPVALRNKLGGIML